MAKKSKTGFLITGSHEISGHDIPDFSSPELTNTSAQLLFRFLAFIDGMLDIVVK